ncbi:hypothetical protein [Nitrobacter sp. JJSN]|uniref:hypothetical protein n=1 Tax=Nitrobacter sp. JJSN TaxID=3453033 RepID=UPI003F770F29
MPLRDWVRLPTEWIEDHGLEAFTWGGTDGKGSDNTAGLMALMAIAHHANDETGVARMTYDEVCLATGLSRAKLSNGLDVLEAQQIITREPAGRSTFGLTNYDRAGGWGKLPARKLYSLNRIAAFSDFHLRSPAELVALKLYFLFVARRGNDTNMANISFDKIEEYTGLERHRIKTGVTLLGAASLVHVEHVPSSVNSHGIANAYRLIGIDSHVHMGTRGRGMEAMDFDGV